MGVKRKKAAAGKARRDIADRARRLLLALPGVEAGRSYGMPSFKLNGRFLARLRDDDTVLVLQIASIAERDVLMQIDDRAFFFTDHYRDYPAVLIRLADVMPELLATVLRDAHDAASAKKPPLA